MVQWALEWGCYKDVCCSLSEVNMKLMRRGGNDTKFTRENVQNFESILLSGMT